MDFNTAVRYSRVYSSIICIKFEPKIASTMKSSMKAFVFSVALLTFTTAASYAQNIHFGLKGGVNMLKLTGRSFDEKFKTAFSAGFFGEYTFSRMWGLQAELNWNEVKGMTTDNFNSIYPGAISTEVYNNYIAVPVMLAFKPTPEISFLIGPQYGYLVNQTTGLLGTTDPNKGVFSHSDISLVFGGQLNLNKVKLGIRYDVGLNNINGVPGGQSTDDWRYHGFQFYIGYRIK